jgi:hypothetical protein
VDANEGGRVAEFARIAPAEPADDVELGLDSRASQRVNDAHRTRVVLPRLNRADRHEPKGRSGVSRPLEREVGELENVGRSRPQERDRGPAAGPGAKGLPRRLGVHQEAAAVAHGERERRPHVEPRPPVQIVGAREQEGIVDVDERTLARREGERPGRIAGKHEQRAALASGAPGQRELLPRDHVEEAAATHRPHVEAGQGRGAEEFEGDALDARDMAAHMGLVDVDPHGVGPRHREPREATAREMSDSA